VRRQPSATLPARSREPVRSRPRLLAAAGLALAAAACGLVPPIGLQAPKVTVADLSIRSLGLKEIRFALLLDARNPNDVDVPLSNLRFDLDLLGRPFASGAALEPTVTLAAGATRSVPIEFAVPTSRLLEVLREVRGSERAPLDYRLHGSANWGKSPFSIPFERRGELETLRKLRELLEPARRP